MLRVPESLIEFRPLIDFAVPGQATVPWQWKSTQLLYVHTAAVRTRTRATAADISARLAAQHHLQRPDELSTSAVCMRQVRIVVSREPVKPRRI